MNSALRREYLAALGLSEWAVRGKPPPGPQAANASPLVPCAPGVSLASAPSAAAATAGASAGPAAREAGHHVEAHPAETDEAELHERSPVKWVVSDPPASRLRAKAPHQGIRDLPKLCAVRRRQMHVQRAAASRIE